MRPPYIAHMHAHATIHRSTARMRLVAQAVRRVFAVPLTRPIRLADRVVVIAIALCTRGISVELVRAAGSHHAVRAFGEIADVIRCLAVEAWVAEQFRYDDILRGPVTKRIPVVFVRPHIGRAQRVPHHIAPCEYPSSTVCCAGHCSACPLRVLMSRFTPSACVPGSTLAAYSSGVT